MNKFVMAGIAASVIAVSGVATASPLVTANVPLDSRYYSYIDKLEGMGYIKDMPTGTRPYSRLDMAKWIIEAQQKAQTKPMPGYLKIYYKEMRADLAEEIAYLQGANTDYDGINIIGAAEISGSLNKDLALSLTPRFSYDKDQHGDASIEEGYVKTHLGVWGIELGKQAVQWGKAPFAMSNNATPQTMLKLNLLEPHTFDNGFLQPFGR